MHAVHHTHRMGRPTHSAIGLLCRSSDQLGRIKQPRECCSGYKKMLWETGRVLPNFINFSPTLGDLIQKCTPQQVSYSSFLPFLPFLAQGSKMTYLVCFYPLSKLPRLIDLWLKGAAAPVDEMVITQLLSHLFPERLLTSVRSVSMGRTAASLLSA